MKFESLNLHPDVLKGIRDAGFEHCTPIQEQSLPECLAGKDAIAQSQTGTGKTAVFLLTIFNRAMSSGPNPTGRPRALVMVPTRELAAQVIDDAVKLGRHLPCRSVAIYGGVEYNGQINALKAGVELVAATPGRMIDLYKSKALSLDDIEIFVIDEADRMFDMGFAPDIMYIADRLPRKKPRQTMLFSATIDSNVRRLASRYMKPDPVTIEIEPEQVTVDAIDQKVVYVSNEEKLSMLLTLLKRPGVERSIIFTNMKVTAEKLGWKLAANGIAAKVLTGDVTQERRHRIIEGMKSGAVKTLIATDVAARGLHIEGITHIFNYDLPDDSANYVHRVGRTARAGKSGKAYSLVCEDHAMNLPEIEKYIERKIESEWIEDSEIVKDIAPEYRPGRERRPEKRVKKPESSRRRERSAPRADKGRPQAGKKAAPPAGEAPARAPVSEGGEGAIARPGDKPRRRRRRRRPADQAVKKETGPGQRPEQKPEQKQERRSEQKSEQKVEHRRADHAPGQRPGRRGASRRPGRPVEAHVERPADRPVSAPQKAEAPQPAAPERNEPAPKGAGKGGILKRLLKLIKKS
ncbi:MAG: DEAD/DEAH box helicase [Deltaproteobacteria bacterium]|nr:DEAD/DEAH box helicase [Deltaproteobacteria bacterium]